MMRSTRGCVLLAVVVATAAVVARARAEERKRDRKATQEEVDRAMERLNKQAGIATDGPRVGPGTSPRDLGAKLAEGLATGNQRGLLSLIVRDWWSSCATPAARQAEHGRNEDVARVLGGLAVEVPRGVKLTKAEPMSAEKRTKKGDELDGCVADHDLAVQRWRLTIAKGKGKAFTQEYELIAVDGQWSLRGP